MRTEPFGRPTATGARPAGGCAASGRRWRPRWAPRGVPRGTAIVEAAGWSPRAGRSWLSRTGRQRTRSGPRLCGWPTMVRDLPARGRPRLRRGLILNRFGHDAEAVQCWQACLKLQPRFAPALYCLGRNAFDQGHYERYIALMKRRWRRSPAMWDALLYTGRSEMHEGTWNRRSTLCGEHVGATAAIHRRTLPAGPGLPPSESRFAGRRAFRGGPGDQPPVQKRPLRTECKSYRRLGEEERARRQLQSVRPLDTGTGRAGRGMRRDYDDQATLRESVANLTRSWAKLYAAAGDTARPRRTFRPGRRTEAASARGEGVTHESLPRWGIATVLARSRRSPWRWCSSRTVGAGGPDRAARRYGGNGDHLPAHRRQQRPALHRRDRDGRVWPPSTTTATG